MKKRLISWILALCMLLSLMPMTAFAAEGYTVMLAGSEELLGIYWNPDPAYSSYQLTDNGEGIYSITLEAVPAGTDYQFKVVRVYDDGSWVWFGNPDGNNITMDVTQTCDVTIYFDDLTGEVSFSGDYAEVPTLKIDGMYAVGTGSGNFLNGHEWDPAASDNRMTEISDNVWEITYQYVAAGEYQVKFAANESWALNWGYDKYGYVSGTVDLVCNADNLYFTVYELSDVTLRIDLTNYDADTGGGAKGTIEIVRSTACAHEEISSIGYCSNCGQQLPFKRSDENGVQFFNSLEEAFAGAEDDTLVTMMSDYYLSTSETVPGGTLEMNGKTLRANDTTNPYLNVADGGVLTLKNGYINNGHVYFRGSASFESITSYYVLFAATAADGFSAGNLLFYSGSYTTLYAQEGGALNPAPGKAFTTDGRYATSGSDSYINVEIVDAPLQFTAVSASAPQIYETETLTLSAETLLTEEALMVLYSAGDVLTEELVVPVGTATQTVELSGLEPGTYTYQFVMSFNQDLTYAYAVISEEITVEVLPCPHSSVTDNVCDDCGKEVEFYTLKYTTTVAEAFIPAGTVFDTKSYVEGSTVEVAFDPLPTYTGHIFLGWATEPDATEPTYAPEGLTSFTINADTTLYAVWAEYTHIHCLCGGSACTDPAHGEVTYSQVWSGTMDTLSITKDSTIVLAGDVSMSDLNVMGGTTNLCLNGYTLTLTGEVYVYIDAVLNICDCSAEQSGTITSSDNFTLNLTKNSTINLYGGRVENAQAGSAVAVRNFGTFSMYGGTVSSTGYAAIDNSSYSEQIGSAYIYGGRVENVGSESMDCVIASDAGCTLVISGATVVGNDSYEVIYNLGTAVITDATIENRNSATSSSNTITNGGTMSISGTTVTGSLNSAIANNNTLVLADSNITGSGKYVLYNSKTATISDCTVSGGTTHAINNSGVLRISGGTFTSEGTHVLYSKNASAVVHISGGKFSGGSNYAVMISSGSVYLSGTPDFSEGDFLAYISSVKIYGHAEGDLTDTYQGAQLTIDIAYSECVSGNILVHESTDVERYALDFTSWGYALETDGTNVVIQMQHTWSEVWSSDATAHWHNCTASQCDITDNSQKDGYALHTVLPDDGDCTTAVTCTVCGYAVVPAMEHSFTDAEDTDCNNEGCTHTHTMPEDDGNCTTAVVCEDCGYVFVEANYHSFTDSEDTTCNNEGCTYTRVFSHSHEDGAKFAVAEGSVLSSGSYYLDADYSTGIGIIGDVVLCLNGHSIEGADAFGISLEDGASLTLCDCHAGTEEDPQGVVYGAVAGIVSTDIGSVTVNGGNVFSYAYGIVISNGTVVINNGSVFGDSYGIYCMDASVSVNGGSVHGDSCGIYDNGASVITVNGGTVSSNYCGINPQYGELTVNGGTISGADYGIYDYAGSVITVNGGTVVGEEEGIESYYSTVIVNGGTITGSYPIFDFEGSTIKVSDGILSGEVGIRISGSILTVTGGTITGTEYAISNVNGSMIYLSGTPTISGNVYTDMLYAYTEDAEGNRTYYTGEPLNLELNAEEDSIVVYGSTDIMKFVLVNAEELGGYALCPVDGNLVLKAHTHEFVDGVCDCGAALGYTVVWVDEMGEELLSMPSVPYGTVIDEAFMNQCPAPTYEDVPLAYHYEPRGWYCDYDTVTESGIQIRYFCDVYVYEETLAPTTTARMADAYYCSETDTYYYEEISYTPNSLLEFNGDLYYVDENGYAVVGLVRLEANGEVLYYYFDLETCKAFKATEGNEECAVEITNGLSLIPANYKFDENGVICHFSDTSIQGIYYDEASGKYYDCVDGVIQARGLFCRDGVYYYARTSTGELVCGQSYYISNNAEAPELAPGKYYFNALGQLVLDGFIELGGKLYFLKDNKIYYGGLFLYEGSYYYARTSNGEVICGREYWITATNGLPVQAGSYTFEADGKMIIPEPKPVKDGIVEENGKLYHYENGKLSYAGLIEIDGDYYYVRTSTSEVICGRSYWVSVTNGLPVKEGLYYFDATGKMVP